VVVVVVVMVMMMMMMMTTMMMMMMMCSLSLRGPQASKRLMNVIFLNICGVHLTVEGREEHYREPVVVLFQHGSNIDGFTILRSFPQYFGAVGKAEIYYIPYVGWMCYAFCIVPIDRKHRNNAFKAMAKAEDRAKRGVAMAIRLVSPFNGLGGKGGGGGPGGV
jgi:1-acyl-sn-glycerol-3-phosphate acyltransferase